MCFMFVAQSYDVEVVSAPTDPPSTADVLKRVFVRANLSCRDDIEVPFYSSECFSPFVHTVHANVTCVLKDSALFAQTVPVAV